MASVLLPDSPGTRSLGWRLIRFGGELQGVLGGASQGVNRLGDRWAVAIAIPALTPAQAGEWSADLTRALRLGARWWIRQVGMPPGSPGTPLVAGANQAGWSIAVDGMTAGYVGRKGQALSIVVDGQRYVHHIATPFRAAADGTATIDIEPALRITPADNGTVEIAKPYIEGQLIWPDGWSLDPDRLARGFTFQIAERR